MACMARLGAFSRLQATAEATAFRRLQAVVGLTHFNKGFNIPYAHIEAVWTTFVGRIGLAIKGQILWAGGVHSFVPPFLAKERL